MVTQVKVWFMTEEERQAYIKKHPIVNKSKPKGSNFSMTEGEFNERSAKGRKARWGYSAFNG